MRFVMAQRRRTGPSQIAGRHGTRLVAPRIRPLSRWVRARESRGARPHEGSTYGSISAPAHSVSTSRLASLSTAVPGSRRSTHSHTTKTRQPAACRATLSRRSRRTLASNLSCQNSRRVVGVLAYLQPGCRCQKQPCTKIAAPYFGRIRSGRPGRFRGCRRKRKPIRCNPLRTSSSGLVCSRRTEAIILDRVSGSTVSGIFRESDIDEEKNNGKRPSNVPCW